MYPTMRYDLRPDKVGWTVFDVTTDRPVVLDNNVALVGIDADSAHEMVALLHRPLTARSKRAQYIAPSSGRADTRESNAPYRSS